MSHAFFMFNICELKLAICLMFHYYVSSSFKLIKLPKAFNLSHAFGPDIVLYTWFAISWNDLTITA